MGRPRRRCQSGRRRSPRTAPECPARTRTSDGFGWSVAVGKLDADRYADIVVAARFEDDSSGQVTIIRGGKRGYARHGNLAFGPETPGVPGSGEGVDDYLGTSTSLLDFNGDGRLDLAVEYNGGVAIFRGSRSGISFKGARSLRFDAEGVTWGSPTGGPNPGLPVIGRAGSSG